MNIFISHSSAEAEIAEEVCALIEKRGGKCFIAPRDISAGKEYAEEIISGIDRSDAMVLLMSKNANDSPHVLREVERAVSKSIPILVYKLEDVELNKSMEYFLMTHQWINADKEKDYSKILEFVSKGKPQNPATGSTETVNGTSDSENTDNKKRMKKRNSAKTEAFIGILLGFLALVAICFVVLHNSGVFTKTEVELGQTLTFGRYNGEDISWRVLHISEDKKEAVLIAENILTMKAYDAAESGSYNSDGITDYRKPTSAADTDLLIQMTVRGNNDWSVSNIRTWLNSADEVVYYSDKPPVPGAMSEHENGYHNEAGFLYDFTKEELEAIVDTEITTTANPLLNSETITTTDKVFLLSLDELEWFKEAGMSMLAAPTEAAINQDGSGWYAMDKDFYGLDEYYWWLREPVAETSSKCYMVTNGYTEETLTANYNVGLEGFGIRPAITVDLSYDFITE